MSSGKFILGAIVGALVGVQVGILVAPDKGENTRKKLSKKGSEYADDVTGKFNEILDSLSKKVSDVNAEVDNLAKKAKSETERYVK